MKPRRGEYKLKKTGIVELVNQSVQKVELKYRSEKEQKTALHAEHARLMDVQRQYAAALKRLAEGRRLAGGEAQT